MTGQEMREQTATLLRKSASDETALGFDGFSPHIAAFHGQQAIEKLLKAWLYSLGVQPPKTHSFVKLVTLLEIEGCSVPRVNVPLARFSDFAVQWRYEDLPEEGTPDLPAMREAVKALREAVVPQIEAALAKIIT
jgi:HEPN domain-containing protein